MKKPRKTIRLIGYIGWKKANGNWQKIINDANYPDCLWSNLYDLSASGATKATPQYSRS